MPVEHDEHQIIKDARLHRGFDETASHDEIFKHEALRMSLLTPEQRAVAIRDFDNRVNSYDEASTNLRKKAQAHRMRTYIQTASDRLKAAGR